MDWFTLSRELVVGIQVPISHYGFNRCSLPYESKDKIPVSHDRTGDIIHRFKHKKHIIMKLVGIERDSLYERIITDISEPEFNIANWRSEVRKYFETKSVFGCYVELWIYMPLGVMSKTNNSSDVKELNDIGIDCNADLLCDKLSIKRRQFKTILKELNVKDLSVRVYHTIGNYQ